LGEVLLKEITGRIAIGGSYTKTKYLIVKEDTAESIPIRKYVGKQNIFFLEKLTLGMKNVIFLLTIQILLNKS
jgi:hypothetical protein